MINVEIELLCEDDLPVALELHRDLRTAVVHSAQFGRATV